MEELSSWSVQALKNIGSDGPPTVKYCQSSEEVFHLYHDISMVPSNVEDGELRFCGDRQRYRKLHLETSSGYKAEPQEEYYSKIESSGPMFYDSPPMYLAMSDHGSRDSPSISHDVPYHNSRDSPPIFRAGPYYSSTDRPPMSRVVPYHNYRDSPPVSRVVPYHYYSPPMSRDVSYHNFRDGPPMSRVVPYHGFRDNPPMSHVMPYYGSRDNLPMFPTVPYHGSRDNPYMSRTMPYHGSRDNPYMSRSGPYDAFRDGPSMSCATPYCGSSDKTDISDNDKEAMRMIYNIEKFLKETVLQWQGLLDYVKKSFRTPLSKINESHQPHLSKGDPWGEALQAPSYRHARAYGETTGSNKWSIGYQRVLQR